MRTFNIQALEEQWIDALRTKVDNLAKPKRSLGKLEQIAVQLGAIYRNLSPELEKPINIVFCADHGVVEEGISQSPKDVTWQVVYNMLSGGAGVCYLSRQHNVELRIVDVGVDRDFNGVDGLVDKKIRRGTRNYLHESALTDEELDQAIEVGVEEVDRAYRTGSNIVSFGEMGITNTSSSALWMSLLTDIPLSECVGRGSGLDAEGVRHKYEVLSRVEGRFRQTYPAGFSPMDVMREVGGLEMVAAVGGMLRAAELGLPILVDGFIMTSCLLVASSLYKEVQQYAIFGHQGDEAGHAQMLRYLGAMPLLHLDLCLGEGSGAVCALPIVRSAALMLREMASFDGAQIPKYFE